MRVGIACGGLEHVRRGYEAASRELFEALSGHVDVILFKGSGRSAPHEVVVGCVKRDFLARFMNPERAFYWEQISFAVALMPHLIWNRVDIIHYFEGNVGNALARFIRWAGLKTKLLFCNGGAYSPNFRPELLIQQVSKEGMDAALKYGVAKERMYLVPHGIATERFTVTEGREILRQRFGLPHDKLVLLALSALDKQIKRLDYVIREVAALKDESLFLCLAGQPTAETAELERLASELLPGRHLFLTVPRAQVPELLGTADVFVHA